MATTIIDSYDPVNLDASFSAGITGQSFTATQAVLESAEFSMYKSGSPTGNIYAKIYTHSGTYGTSSIPTGEALATSDAIDISSLPADIPTSITFTFSEDNKITLVGGTYYCVSIEYTKVGLDSVRTKGDQTDAAHSGNYYFYDTKTSEWVADSDCDVGFYIYGDKTIGPFPTFFKQ